MKNKEQKDLPLLQGRCKLAYNWIPENTEKLLDAGCSTGYCTVHYALKARETYAIDIVPAQIQEAKSNFPHINFQTSALEEIPFDDEYFDTVICTDVLEHTNDKIKSLSELFRVLKPGGTLVLSVPHRGKYQYFDPYNYGFYMRKYLKPVHILLYKTARLLKEKKWPKGLNPDHSIMHHHYDSDELIEMMNQAGFANYYKIEEIFRSGLYWEVLSLNIEQIFPIFRLNYKKMKFVQNIYEKSRNDYWVEYGSKAYNIALKIKKL